MIKNQTNSEEFDSSRHFSNNSKITPIPLDVLLRECGLPEVDSASKTSPFFQRLDIKVSLDTPPAAIDHILPGFIAGSIGALVAPGGTGKTFFEMALAVSVSGGIPVAGGAFPAPEKTGRVVMLAGEDNKAILANRMYAIGQWLKKGYSAGSHPLLDQDTLRGIYNALDERLEVYPLDGVVAHLVDARGKQTPFFDHLKRLAEGARLLIIDPLRRFHGGDENDSLAMTQVVQHLESVIKETGCTILLAHHTNKSAALNGSGELQQALRGSSALTERRPAARYCWRTTPISPPRSTEVVSYSRHCVVRRR